MLNSAEEVESHLSLLSEIPPQSGMYSTSQIMKRTLKFNVFSLLLLLLKRFYNSYYGRLHFSLLNYVALDIIQITTAVELRLITMYLLLSSHC